MANKCPDITPEYLIKPFIVVKLATDMCYLLKF